MDECLDATKTQSIIDEYDLQISQLASKRRSLIEERNDLQKCNKKNSNYYETAVKAKNEWGSALDNIAGYARKNKIKVESKVKIIREMYEYIEESVNQPGVNNQFDSINATIKAASNTFSIVETKIVGLDNQIKQIELEIERIKAMRGEVLNG